MQTEREKAGERNVELDIYQIFIYNIVICIHINSQDTYKYMTYDTSAQTRSNWRRRERLSWSSSCCRCSFSFCCCSTSFPLEASCIDLTLSTWYIHKYKHACIMHVYINTNIYCKYTYTHVHVYIYMYMYIYIWT